MLSPDKIGNQNDRKRKAQNDQAGPEESDVKQTEIATATPRNDLSGRIATPDPALHQNGAGTASVSGSQ